MEILRMSRPYEDIYFEDPMDNPQTPRFRVYFDDRSIEEMLGKVANAIDRAQSLDRKAKAASTPDERAEVTEMMVHLQKRVIVSFIGPDGYQKLLEWMGDGEVIDPAKHVSALGEVFAQLMMLLGRKATNEQLRACGLYYSQESKKTAEFLRSQQPGRAQFNAVQGGKKKHRK